MICATIKYVTFLLVLSSINYLRLIYATINFFGFFLFRNANLDGANWRGKSDKTVSVCLFWAVSTWILWTIYAFFLHWRNSFFSTKINLTKSNRAHQYQVVLQWAKVKKNKHQSKTKQTDIWIVFLENSTISSDNWVSHRLLLMKTDRNSSSARVECVRQRQSPSYLINERVFAIMLDYFIRNSTGGIFLQHFEIIGLPTNEKKKKNDREKRWMDKRFIWLRIKSSFLPAFCFDHNFNWKCIQEANGHRLKCFSKRKSMKRM